QAEKDRAIRRIHRDDDLIDPGRTRDRRPISTEALAWSIGLSLESPTGVISRPTQGQIISRYRKGNVGATGGHHRRHGDGTVNCQFICPGYVGAATCHYQGVSIADGFIEQGERIALRKSWTEVGDCYG